MCWFPFLNQLLIVVFIKEKKIELKNIFGLRHSAYISDDVQKKNVQISFFFLQTYFFLLIVKWRMDPKSGGGQTIVRLPLSKKWGGPSLP